MDGPAGAAVRVTTGLRSQLPMSASARTYQSESAAVKNAESFRGAGCGIGDRMLGLEVS